MLRATYWPSIVTSALLSASCPTAGMARTPSLDSCSIAPTMPNVPKNAKTLVSTSEVDATGAAIDVTRVIQEALDHLKAGEWLVFEPGVYRISKTLSVVNAGVTLYGRGATLFSNSATDGGILVRADNVAVYGLTLDQASVERQSAPWSGGIAVYDETDHKVRRVRGSIIQKNVVKNAAAGGIFLYAAENFTVAGNTVWRSLADGIHVTAGSANGRIIANKVSETGDDMIAVVSYAGSAAEQSSAERYKDWAGAQQNLDRNIYIAANHVDNQYWGRGISVVGGSGITIENNYISKTPFAAGIYLEREISYRTFGVSNVLVSGNHISDVQTTQPSFERGTNSHRLTGHGAVEIGSLQDDDELADPTHRAAFSISNVAIVDNTIRHAQFAGIRVGVGAPNTVSDLLIRGNQLSNVAAKSVVEIHSGVDPASVHCSSNTLNGTVWVAKCATLGGLSRVAPPATGATLQCSRDSPPRDTSPASGPAAAHSGQ